MTDDLGRLRALFQRLDDGGRRTLLELAEFLAARQPERAPPPSEKIDLPRPEGESVVAALQRLRRSYPMIDSTRMLDAAATGMTRHVLHGRAAVEVIDDLERLFADAYRQQRPGAGEPQ